MISDLEPIQARIVAAKRATRDDIHEALTILKDHEGRVNVPDEITALVKPVYSPAQTAKLLTSLDSYAIA